MVYYKYLLSSSCIPACYLMYISLKTGEPKPFKILNTSTKSANWIRCMLINERQHVRVALSVMCVFVCGCGFFLFLMMSELAARLVYTRDDLLMLRSSRCGVKHLIPAELRNAYRRCRAGAKLKQKVKDTSRFCHRYSLGMLTLCLISVTSWRQL